MKDAIRLYREVLALLPARGRRFLLFYVIALSALAFLDAGALGLLAATLTPMVTGSSLTLPFIGELRSEGLLPILGIACALIIAKSTAQLALLRAASKTFARYETALGGRVFEAFITAPWLERLKRNSAEVVRLTGVNVPTTISGFLLPAATLPGEILSFVSIIAVLGVTQPLIAAVTLVYLLIIGILLYAVITPRARRNGREGNVASRRATRLALEVIGTLKEITLRNKTGEAASAVRRERARASKAKANAQVLGQVPRFVLDAGVIGGGVLVGFVGAITGGLPGAMSAIALFGIAGFRLSPSIIRIQSVAAQLAANQSQVESVVDEIRAIESATKDISDRPSELLPQQPQVLRFEHASFKYAPDARYAVQDLNISIPFGSSVAFVGSSGAGKSTIVDLLLGLIEPTEGRVLIDGADLTEVTHAWRDRVGYVPQDVALFDASIAQNVALAWDERSVDRDEVRRALDQAQLLETVDNRPDGIDSAVGERGLALSGGQRQRLAIARALYPRPLVLVMDEATSSLDTSTEAAVTDAIRGLQGEVTLIMVAHRLSTVVDVDRLFFMSQGAVVASGSFAELVEQVPEFARQAALAGLIDGPEQQAT
jgi:ABC-type multidrug transport system fused ATPase/permease subunit